MCLSRRRAISDCNIERGIVEFFKARHVEGLTLGEMHAENGIADRSWSCGVGIRQTCLLGVLPSGDRRARLSISSRFRRFDTGNVRLRNQAGLGNQAALAKKEPAGMTTPV